HVLRRELGLRGDIRDFAAVALVRIGVGRDHRLLPEPHRAQAILGHVNAHPAVVRIHDRQNRRARRHDFTRLVMAHAHDAVEARANLHVREHGLERRDLRARLFLIDARDLVRHLRLVVRLLSDRAAAEERLAAFEVALGFGQANARGVHLRPRLRQTRFGLARIQPREHLALLHGVTFAHCDLLDAPRRLESELRFGRLDRARGEQRRRAAVGAKVAPTGIGGDADEHERDRDSYSSFVHERPPSPAVNIAATRSALSCPVTLSRFKRATSASNCACNRSACAVNAALSALSKSVITPTPCLYLRRSIVSASADSATLCSVTCTRASASSRAFAASRTCLLTSRRVRRTASSACACAAAACSSRARRTPPSSIGTESCTPTFQSLKYSLSAPARSA